MTQARLLIVDDEAANMKALCETLEHSGYSTTGFTSALEALKAVSEQQFDLILTDLMMPEMDGITLLRSALEIDSSMVGILMTGHGAVETAVEAMKAGALDYVLKPFKLSLILPVIARALTVRRLRTENVQLREAVAIYELGLAIAFESDPAGIAEKIADVVFKHSEAGEVSVLLPAADGSELRVAVAQGPNAGAVKGRRVPMTDAIMCWAVRTHRLLSNPEELAEPHSALSSPFPDISSDVSVPMFTAGKLAGILNFTQASRNRPVALGRIKTLNMLAGTAASALETASLVDRLRSAEERYRRLADNAPDMISRYELLPEPHYSYVSPAVAAILGYTPEDFYADPGLVYKLVRPEDRHSLEAILRGDSFDGNTTTLRFSRKDGAVVWLEHHYAVVTDNDGSLVAVEAIARDISERKRLEEQLLHSQRMESIGRLAGGVAHDFNNLLTVINGYSDLTLSESPAGSVQHNIQQVRKAGRQAADLTRQLLAFSRKQLLQPRLLNINDIVQSSGKLLKRMIGEDIELVTALDPKPGLVRADPGQLEQILMNLAVNARDAMPDGGKLTIETAGAVLGETTSRRDSDVEPGAYVLLTVSDTGSGMDETTRSRIFEPFFTTKEMGRGTGLGLSIVYGIVKQSKGSISVSSEPRKGTTFKIYLPHAAGSGNGCEPTPRSKTIRGGSETILLVEDDLEVRELIHKVLEGAGYQVLKALGCGDAVEIFQQHTNRIRLVLTDLVMPEMSGSALLDRLREINPATRALYMSGYSDDVIVRHTHLDEKMPFLSKPFDSDSLLRKVREVLDSV